MALPATKVSAPARQQRSIVSRLIPPSTSSAARLPTASSSRRARAILSTLRSMNDCPPKPGLTDMTSSRSRSAATSSTATSGVEGLMTTPARHPSSLIRASCRFRCGATSAWMVSPVAPALAKLSKYFSGSTTMRCTSSGSSVTRLAVSITLAPKVRFGTKQPSMTSTWIQSAPPATHMAISSPSRAKSALRIEGAMRTMEAGSGVGGHGSGNGETGKISASRPAPRRSEFPRPPTRDPAPTAPAPTP